MSTTPSMTDAKHDDAATVRQIVVEELRANQPTQNEKPQGLDSVTDDIPLGDGGLGISSLLLLRIFVKLEESFSFTFEDAAVANAKFLTVGDLVSFVSGAVRSHRATGLESK